MRMSWSVVGLGSMVAFNQHHTSLGTKHDNMSLLHQIQRPCLVPCRGRCRDKTARESMPVRGDIGQVELQHVLLLCLPCSLVAMVPIFWYRHLTFFSAKLPSTAAAAAALQAVPSTSKRSGEGARREWESCCTIFCAAERIT